MVEDRLALESLQLNPDRLKSRGANSFAERKREEAMRREVKSLDRITTEVIRQLLYPLKFPIQKTYHLL